MTRFAHHLVALGVALSFIAACGQGHLTVADAQRAVDKLKQDWLESEVKRLEDFGVTVTDAKYLQLEAQAKKLDVAKVLTVQELPAVNEATADLDIGGATGKAHFVHYTDGRWVLTAVEWSGGSRLDKLNIPIR